MYLFYFCIDLLEIYYYFNSVNDNIALYANVHTSNYIIKSGAIILILFCKQIL